MRRDGQVQTVKSSELVPGDIVLLEAGDIVPADLRLLKTASLQIEEAALTGESVPVDKSEAPLAQSKLPLGDRKNLGYMNTNVTYGTGEGVVIATGMELRLDILRRCLTALINQLHLYKKILFILVKS